jgi:hypothetical protein
MGLFDIFSNTDQRQAANDQIAGINAGYGQLSDLFGQGRSAINTNYADALAPFTQNYSDASGGVDQLKKLLGIGPGGAGDISKTLENMPGYQFTLDQGNQNVLRNQAATGQLNSGATNIDLQKFGQGTAQQQYGNYVNQLMPFLQAAGGAASGIGAVKTGQGNALNANLTNQGNAAYGAQTSIGNANANADLANLTASQNMWGALLGGLSAGFKAPTLSDKRAKDDIEPVGELFDGQPIYRYRYKGDARHQIGLIAQEVERDHPDAVVTDMGAYRENLRGLKGVDYRRATDMAAELGRFLKAA